MPGQGKKNHCAQSKGDTECVGKELGYSDGTKASSNTNTAAIGSVTITHSPTTHKVVNPMGSVCLSSVLAIIMGLSQHARTTTRQRPDS